MQRLINDVQVIGLSDAIKEQAIQLRKHRLLKLPDAIVCATALIEQAVLLTNDTKLHEVAGLQCRSLVLSELGRSRLASNMNQLAKAANIETLDFSDSVVRDLQEACRAIAQMREMLVVALGLKPEGGESSFTKVTED